MDDIKPAGGDGLLLPQLVPVENKLILSPEAQSEREAMLAAIEAEEAERGYDDDDDEPALAERVKRTVCKTCGHPKLVFLPARLCEKCLRRAASEAGIPFPEATGRVAMNRAQRRAAVRRKR